MNELILKAISDGTRLRILKKVQKGEICACKIPTAMRITQSAGSQHLKVLSEAKLVRMRKQGKNRLYSITEKGQQILQAIAKW